MSYRIEIELDEEGRLVFPVPIAQQLGLAQGTMLIVEQETEKASYLRIHVPNPEYVDKEGVFVIPGIFSV